MKTVIVGLLFLLSAHGLPEEKEDAALQGSRALAVAIAKSHARFYRTLRAYTEEATVEYRYEGKLGEVDLSQQNRTTLLRLTSIRGRGCVLESADTAMYLDGEEMTLYRPMEARYQTRKIKSDHSLAEIIEQVDAPFRILRWHPALLGLYGESGPEGTVVPEIRRWDSIKRDALGDRAVWHVRVRVAGEDRRAPELPLQIWLDSGTCQVLRMELDLTPTLPVAKMQPAGEKPATGAQAARAVVIFSVVRSAQKPAIDDTRLRFRPSPGDRKVDQLLGSQPLVLVGTRVPHFEATTLSGERFSSQAHHGRLLLLDFWATWCGKCVAHMPVLEEINREFRDELVVVGVNADESGRGEQVRQVLTRQKCTFPQVLDPQGGIQRQFRVAGFPSLVLVDKKGIICDIFPSTAPLSELRSRIQEELSEGKAAAEDREKSR